MIQLNQVSHRIFQLENIAYQKLFLLTNEQASPEAQTLRRLPILPYGFPLGNLNVLIPHPFLLFLITAIFLRFYDCTDGIFCLLTAIQWDRPRNSCLFLLKEVLDLQTDTLGLQNRLDFLLCATLYVPFSLLNPFPCLWDEDSHVGFGLSLRDTWKFVSLVFLAWAM